MLKVPEHVHPDEKPSSSAAYVRRVTKKSDKPGLTILLNKNLTSLDLLL